MCYDFSLSRSTRARVCQILGVAGRMVRTRGPWRCILSTGVQQAFAGGLHSSSGAKGGSSTEEGKPSATLKATVSSSSHVHRDEGATESGETRALLLTSGSTLLEDLADRIGCWSSSSGDRADARAESGKVPLHIEDKPVVLSTGDGGVVTVTQDGGCGTCLGTPSVAETDAVADQEEEGVLYLNTVTGEAVREPPAELLALSAEAENVGDYLIFVPSRSFVAAVASSSSTVAPSAVSLRQSDSRPPLSAAGSSASFDDGTSAGAGAENEEVMGLERPGCRPTVAPTPPIVVRAAGQCGTGGGGEVWDRLTCMPTSKTTPVHFCSSEEPTSSTCGGGGGSGSGSDVVLAWSPPLAATAVVHGSAVEDGVDTVQSSKVLKQAAPDLPVEIDMSQGSVASPLMAENAGDGDRNREGAGPTEGVWSCIACTLQNGPRARVCTVCRTAKPKVRESQVIRF